MDASTRRTLIDQYRAGYAAVVDALAGADDAALDRRPGPGTWSAREIVHHLADSEMTSAIRLRRLIAEENPTIVGYDQEAFARAAALRPPDRVVARSLPLGARLDRRDPRPPDRGRLGAEPARTARAAPTASPAGSRSTPSTPIKHAAQIRRARG